MLKLNSLSRGGFMIGTGLLMGLLFSFQSKSVMQANLNYNRENRVSIFKEMQIVKKSNENLNDQMNGLQKELAATSNKEQALESIKSDIAKYELASGKTAVHGSGVSITISGELESLWFTDLVNELFSAGAEAVSLNGIRIVDKNIGFDTMPNGQILFGGEIISAPFNLQAIGDSKTMIGSITQTGGILQRIMSYKPKYDVKAEEKEDVAIPKIESSN